MICKTPDDLVPFSLSFYSTQEKRTPIILDVFMPRHHWVQFCRAHRNP